MIKAVIFDLDGTLVNAYPAVSSSVNYTLSVLQLPPRSHVQIKRSVGGGDRHLMEHFVGKARVEEAIALYRPHHTKALQIKGGVRFLPGVLPILNFLKKKGYKLGIVSNRPTAFTQIILKTLKAEDFFDKVLCADKAPRPKPYPDMLLQIIKGLKLQKLQVLYVGDMTLDIQTAQAADVRVVAVSTGSSSKNELKDLKPWKIISKMSLLKPLMEKIS